jgi:hypothetical protein
MAAFDEVVHEETHQRGTEGVDQIDVATPVEVSEQCPESGRQLGQRVCDLTG